MISEALGKLPCYNLDEVTATQIEAGNMSTLSGILAALMFASIMILISNTPPTRHVTQFSTYIYLLLVVFALLLLCTFLYVPVSGGRFRPEQELNFLIANLILGLAVVQMFIAILWFLFCYDIFSPGREILKLLLYVVVLIVSINILNAVAQGFFNVSSCFQSYPNEFAIDPWDVALLTTPTIFMALLMLPKTNMLSLKHESCIVVTSVVSLIYAIMLTVLYIYIMGFWSNDQIAHNLGNKFLQEPVPYSSRRMALLSMGLFFALSVAILPSNFAELSDDPANPAPEPGGG